MRKRTSRTVLLRLDMDVAGAVLGRLEDDRVDEPDERGVRDAVLGLEIVLLVDDLELVVVDPRTGFGLAGPAEALELREQLVLRARRRARGSAASPSAARRCAAISLGSAIATRSTLALDLVRQRLGPLEHGQRDLLDRLGRDVLVAEVDERQVVPLRPRAGNALGRSQALVDERLRQRAAPGPAACCSQTIGGTSPVRLEQVGDELGELVQVVPAGGAAGRTVSGGAGAPLVVVACGVSAGMSVEPESLMSLERGIGSGS